VSDLDWKAATAGGEFSPSAFKYRGFVLYWSARFLNAFSIQITSVAVGWQIYDRTRDPFLLGLVGLVQFAPALALVLLTGSTADRFNRRRIMGTCIAVEGLCVAALLALTWSAPQAVWPIFIILTIFGIARAFFAPAMQSLAANLVPAVAFPNAVAWNSSSWQTAVVVGPVAGGLLYGVSPMAAFGTSALCLLAAATLTFLIPKPAQRTSAGPTSTETILAGFRYIWSQPVVLGAISIDLFAVLLGGATALMPAYARDILEAGPWGLGLLRSAPGIGAVAMGVWLVSNPIRDRAGYVMFASVAIFGVSIIVFGLSEAIWLSVIALAIMGAADMVSVYIRASLIQLSTPDELRGRVSAVNTVFIGASNELGEFRAGTMGALIGVVPSVVVGGIGTLIVAALGARVFPELLNTRRLAGR
jgi:MFS family permease